jgi:hypothetical protein
MRRDDRSWLLFLYLVYHVPCQALARILIEGDFVQNLEACLRDGGRTRGLVSTNSDSPDSAISRSESNSKKRKRDKSGQVVIQEHNQEPSPDTFSALRVGSIYAAIKRCVDLSTTNVQQASSEHIRLALAASVPIAASVISRLISDLMTILSQEHLASFYSNALIQSVPNLLALWEYRTAEDAGSTEGRSDQEFTNHCLSSCLAFLLALKQDGLATRYSETVQKVERLIAIHSVLPARAEFTSLRNPQASSRAKDTPATSPILDTFSRMYGDLSPLLYDIAVRTIPRNTVRRRQSEQPWLEALFSKLTTSSGHDGLQELLGVVLTHKVVLPHSELSQIALRQLLNVKIRWPLLVQILEIDASVFFSGSAPLVGRLCDSVADSGAEHYALVRDSIVIPLTRAAAETRELQKFVKIWRGMLAKGIQEDSSDLGRRGSRVWQDPDVIAAFTEITKTYATPFFVHSILRDSLEQITRSHTEEKATFGALAWTAILGGVITARVKDCVTESDNLERLIRATAGACIQSGCPDPQRWRFLRLLRQILNIWPDRHEDGDIILDITGNGIRYKSLGDFMAAEADSSEVMECFHLLVCRAVAQPLKYQEVLHAEFTHLAGLFQELCNSSAGLSLSGFADACLGILLQNPGVLLLAPMATLWPALWRYAATSESTTTQRLFEAIVSSDTVTSNHALFSQCFQAIQESMVGNEAPKSHFAYKILSSMPCQNIKRSQERTKLIRMLEDAGVAKSAEDLIAPPNLKSEDNPLFQEFKSRASSSGAISQPGACLRLREADTFERLCLELDYAKLILSTPNQYLVDDLLSILTLLTSPNSPTFKHMPQNGPSAIYQRLCLLTGVLLTQFRKRLGGRYHLLLPVLQGLLRCLFNPIPVLTSSKQPQIRHHQPHWLTDQVTEPLSAKSAMQYTRLLTSLCDPTASSVKHSRRTPTGLTDDTKKARSIAGQYMQYLVMEYARCQLQGQLPPEVKAALMPGLYAVLDVMTRDLMREMNSAMDSSSRAIFKGLYEDYQRFGRWNQN